MSNSDVIMKALNEVIGAAVGLPQESAEVVEASQRIFDHLMVEIGTIQYIKDVKVRQAKADLPTGVGRTVSGVLFSTTPPKV